MSKTKIPAKEKPIVVDFKSRIEDKPLKQLHPNEENPRIIKRRDFERLKTSIRTNPNMLMLRPVVYDTGGKIIAGNYRYRACVDLGLKTIPAINASKLSKKEKEHFLLWDNENVGQWNFEELDGWANLYGITVPEKTEGHKYNDANCEMPIVPKFDEKYRAVVIVVKTEMDFANLCTTLNLGKAKDYKTSRVKQTQVIGYEDLMKLITKWKKSK